MLNIIKSVYGRACVVLVATIWGAYLGQHVALLFLIFLPVELGQVFRIALPVLMFIAISVYIWPKTSYLREESVLNGNKATIGFFLLTFGLLAFPGTIVIPLAYAASSDRSEVSMYAWYSFFGLPVFVLLSIAGLALIASARPKPGK